VIIRICLHKVIMNVIDYSFSTLSHALKLKKEKEN